MRLLAVFSTIAVIVGVIDIAASHTMMNAVAGILLAFFGLASLYLSTRRKTNPTPTKD